MTPERWQQINHLVNSVITEDEATRSAILQQSCADDASLRRGVDALLSLRTIAPRRLSEAHAAYSPERWQRIEQLFEAAQELEPAKRADYLALACAGDDALRQEVESLLVYQAGVSGLIQGAIDQAVGWFVEGTAEAARFAPGATLNQRYRIAGLLGKGGMGEVYRAKDTRLNREVAIKALPRSLANDAERLRRFEQEARATSALNHPHILTVFDINSHEGSPYIVAELLEGEELRAQLNEGALPHRQALDYAQQIASGLAAAHEKGITHRDLKPENLFVTADGRVKILDFGLAKLKPAKLAAGAVSEASTRKAITGPGMMMGTVGYMSPEQVQGQEADHRSDIFAFGLILYEMLTGRQAFLRETMAETMTAILKEEPEEVTAINHKASPQLEQIVRRCLQKKPERRFQSTSDLGFALETLTTPSGSRLETAAALPAMARPIGETRLVGNARLWMAIAGFLFLALLAALPFVIAYLRRAPASAEVTRFSLSPPEGWSFGNNVISPDGRRVAFIGLAQGKRLLWVRSLETLTAQSLPGTEGVQTPFWSPDSRSLGFFSEGKLKKIDLSGGLPQSLYDTVATDGGTWSREGVIIFGSDGGLFRIPANGGEASVLTTTDQARHEASHQWPCFLPDGQHFVFCVDSPQAENRGIFLGSLNEGRLQRLTLDFSTVAYAASTAGGYLLFVRGGALMAQPFDADKLSLTGEPVRVAEQVRYNLTNGYGFFSVSENGVLAYELEVSTPNSQLVWVDRTGKPLGIAASPGIYNRFRLAPDERRMVLDLTDSQTGRTDLYIRDLQQGKASRFTFDPANNTFPIWSPDGSRIVWHSNRGTGFSFYQKSASGMGQDELLLPSEALIYPCDWSTDGRFIVYTLFDHKTGWDVWALPLEGERNPFPLLQSPSFEGGPRLSPDGHWLAYYTNETGRYEVYVTTFPSPGAKWQISTAGGAQPQWRRDGRELYYVSADGKLMAVTVKGGASFEAGVPQALCEMRMPYTALNNATFYNAAGDGQRFLINTPLGGTTAAPLTVVVNWMAELKR